MHRRIRSRIPLVLALTLVPLAAIGGWGGSSQAAPAAQAPSQAAASGDEPLEVGEQKAADVRLGYGIGAAAARHVVSYPGATYVKVHFGALRLRPGDHVTVSDKTGREVYRYHGAPGSGRLPADSSYTLHGRAGFAAMSVEGDTAVITLHRAAGSSTALARQGYGVHVDGVWRGYTDTEVASHNPQANAVCGGDGRRDTVCYKTSHPTEYARSLAVAKLRIGGGACTAWRVGSTNRMITNNHCISDQKGVSAAEIEFDYECRSCGGNDPNTPVKVSGDQFFRTSPVAQLDYTLFSVKDFASIQRFGTLFLDPRPPRQGERIYIAGHGAAKPKLLSIFEEPGDAAKACTITAAQTDAHNTGYSCDTLPGSSGSPVLAASSHKAIALHHFGGCPNNQGARVDLIYEEIKDLIANQ